MSDEIKPVLCVGDLVVDIFASPLKQLPGPGESVVTERIAVYPGGNSLNAAVALRRMGDEVTVAGSIGDDVLGALLLNQLLEIGVNVDGVRKESGGTTASTFILRAGGEDRRFVSALGVGAGFTGEHVSKDLIPDNGIVLVGGYLKLPAWNDEILLDFLRQARKQNNRVVLNVCLVRNNGVEPERCLRLLEHVDVFLPNEDEARAITGEQKLDDQCEALLKAGAGIVVITRGSEGLYAHDGTKAVTMGSFQVPVVDPSGCGDCFTAGLLAALRRDWDITSMLKLASASGALGATSLGCTTGIPPFPEVEQFLSKNRIAISVSQ